MEIIIKPKRIVLVLGIIICLLIAGNIVSILLYDFLQPEARSSLDIVLEYLNVRTENSFPTYFSTLQLFFSAAVLFLIAIIRKKQKASDYLHWIYLAAIFLFLSMDESIMIHEVIARKIKHHIALTGVFFYAWIIPYSLFVIAVLVAYIPFLRKLPPSTKKGMVLSGGIFVTGALGFEALESWYFTSTGITGLLYQSFTTIEEAMEMTGILLFIYTLLRYLELQLGRISIIFSAPKQPPAASPTLNGRQEKK